MTNETETETARAMIAVLSAEPPAAMVALALQHLPENTALACRTAALGCAMQGFALDLSERDRECEPAGMMVDHFDTWLNRKGDTMLRIWSLHFACLMLADRGEEIGASPITDAASWLYLWFTEGKLRRPMLGYS